jgi:hypothetical protein
VEAAPELPARLEHSARQGPWAERGLRDRMGRVRQVLPERSVLLGAWAEREQADRQARKVPRELWALRAPLEDRLPERKDQQEQRGRPALLGQQVPSEPRELSERRAQ